MKINEALKILEVAKSEIEWSAPLEYQEAFFLAIEALEKQLPRKPKETVHPKISELHPLLCPRCGAEIGYRVVRYIANRGNSYCGKCGQAIDFEALQPTNR